MYLNTYTIYRINSTSDRCLRVTPNEFIDCILKMFRLEYPKLRRVFAEETLGWAVQNFDAEVSLRAIRIFLCLVRGSVTVFALDGVLSLGARFFDQIHVLANIEHSMTEVTILEEVTNRPVPRRKSSVTGPQPGAVMQRVSVPETWSNLAPEKMPAKDSAVEILVAILQLHKEVLSSDQDLELEMLCNEALYWLPISYVFIYLTIYQIVASSSRFFPRSIPPGT
jgi:hypothetical protein